MVERRCQHWPKQKVEFLGTLSQKCFEVKKLTQNRELCVRRKEGNKKVGIQKGELYAESLLCYAGDLLSKVSKIHAR